jgi:hypothetical protein
MDDSVSKGRELAGAARRLGRPPWSTRLATVIFLAAAVVSGYRDLQPNSPVQHRFIGHADRANMAVLARNIAEGTGAVVDMVWLLRDGGVPGNEVTAPEPYWSVYGAAWVAAFFLFLGASQQSMVLAGVVAKVLVAGLTAVWTRRLTRQVFPALAVAIVLLFSPRMSGTVDGLSDIYLTLAMLVGGTALCYACVRGGAGAFFSAGLSCGLAIGVKPTGLLLCGAIIGFGLLLRERHRWRAAYVFLALGIAVGLAPLAWHNHSAFGRLISPANGLVVKAAAIRWLTGNHNLAFYGPEPYEFTDSQLEALRHERPRALLVGYIQRMADGEIVLEPLLVLMPLSVILVFWRWRRPPAPEADANQLFAAFVLMMLAGGLALSPFAPYEPRYWNFLVPLSTALAFWTLRQIWPPLAPLMGAYLLLTTLGQLDPPRQPRRIPPVYQKIERSVPRNSVLLTRDPWEVAFHTRRRAVALPYTADATVLLSVARRYRAEYLVIVRGSADHPIYEPIKQGQFPRWLEKVRYERNLVIGRLRHPASVSQR